MKGKKQRFLKIFVLVIWLSLNLNAFPQKSKKNLPPDMIKFKKINLNKLKANDALGQSILWKKFSKICIVYEDREVMEKIFQLGDTADGAGASEYQQWITRIFKNNPLFLIMSAHQFYKGNFDKILYWLLDGDTEFWLFKEFDMFMIKIINKNPNCKIIKSFLNAAKKYHDEKIKKGTVFHEPSVHPEIMKILFSLVL